MAFDGMGRKEGCKSQGKYFVEDSFIDRHGYKNIATGFKEFEWKLFSFLWDSRLQLCLGEPTVGANVLAPTTDNSLDVAPASF